MPRFYKPKLGAKQRLPIDPAKIREAVLRVNQGRSIRGTAKNSGIPRTTLKRYIRRQQATAPEEISYCPDHKSPKIFSKMEEDLLAQYLLKASNLHHGLTPRAVRILAYQFAIQNNKPVSTRWSKKIASIDWYHGFMKRNSQLSLRVPEATSLSRSTSFNKHNVSKFYNNLRTLLEHNHFGADDVWNIDEIGLTTVHIPRRIVACKGQKQVGKVTSGERGVLVTACCAMNAMGNHIPPWQDRMQQDAPPGTNGSTSPSGWMTGENFCKFLKHFVTFSKCSIEKPCLIIMDNHDSHISIASLTFAKENGINLLTIPPHTSHKLQPLDTAVYGPLKTYYNTACDNWKLANPGKTITIYDVAGCFGKAFPQAFTCNNIQSGFRVTGIFPFNSDIFMENDFLSSYVTDRPLPADLDENSQSQSSAPPIQHQRTASTDPVLKTPEDIQPFPKAAPRKSVRIARKKGDTQILTDSPTKNRIVAELQMREAKKLAREQKQCRSAKGKH